MFCSLSVPVASVISWCVIATARPFAKVAFTIPQMKLFGLVPQA